MSTCDDVRMAIFGRFRAARLVTRVNTNMSAAVHLLQSGQAATAVPLNAQAINDVRKLMDLEPDDMTHHRMLGQLHYNGAAMFEQIGRVGDAVTYARFALSAYSRLPGAHDDPERSIQGGRTAPAVPPEERLVAIGLVADTKARLARLLARADGAEAADEVHELGHSAIATYEKLAAVQPQRRSNLERVRHQYAEARRALAAERG
jgi:hypothetical protein